MPEARVEVWKSSPLPLQLVSENAAALFYQKCSVNNKTSSDSPLARGRVENDWIFFNIWVKLSFKWFSTLDGDTFSADSVKLFHLQPANPQILESGTSKSSSGGLIDHHIVVYQLIMQ